MECADEFAPSTCRTYNAGTDLIVTRSERTPKAWKLRPTVRSPLLSRAIDRLARMRAIGCPLLTAYSVCFCACTNRQKRFGTERGRRLRWSRSNSRRRRMSPYGIGRGSQGSRQNLSGKPATTLGSSPRAGFHALLKIPRLTALRCAPVRRRPGCASPKPPPNGREKKLPPLF